MCAWIVCLLCLDDEMALYIHDNLFRPDLQPPNINSTSVTTVDEGSDLTLSCDHLNSNPVTQFYWRTPNGSIINGTVNLALILPLTNILRSSSGNYTCTVQDDRNNTASSSVTIIVQCKSVQPIWECRECMCDGGGALVVLIKNGCGQWRSLRKMLHSKNSHNLYVLGLCRTLQPYLESNTIIISFCVDTYTCTHTHTHTYTHTIQVPALYA